MELEIEIRSNNCEVHGNPTADFWFINFNIYGTLNPNDINKIPILNPLEIIWGKHFGSKLKSLNLWKQLSGNTKKTVGSF